MNPALLETRAGALPPHAFGALYDRTLDMVHVRGLVGRDAIEAVLDRLETSEAAYPPDHAYADVRTFGKMIAPTWTEPQGPELEAYRAACATFEREQGEALAPLREAVLGVLSALSGVEARVAPGYGFGSVRRMPAGCGSLVHRDFYPDLPAYAELRDLCDLQVQMSWYVQLTLPDEGGALRVYSDDREEWVDWRPEPGDLLLHPGSACWHEVLPATGPVARHTLGGFCAWSRSHDAVLSWA